MDASVVGVSSKDTPGIPKLSREQVTLVADHGVDGDYHAGAFGHAAAEKASLSNEQATIGLTTPRGKLVVRQIAGLVARRIVTDHPVGTAVHQGDRLGMIRFGSRVDLFMPLGTRVLVGPGDTTRAGVTVVAQWS